jgi:hypothetical protein
MSTLKFCGVTPIALALTISGVLVIAQQGRSQEKGDQKHHSETMLACAKACSDCQRECDSCASHCARLVSEGKKAHLTTLMTCQDCANVCTAAAQIVSRGGPFSTLICESCAEACARCGKECEKFAGDQHMKMCAEECHKCEKACREMAKEMKKSV